jgi:hypothetical protein
MIDRLKPIFPRKVKAHNDVQYLRAAPLTMVVEYLKRRMLTPINVKARDMPLGQNAWNNFPTVTYTAHAVYCALEGECLHTIAHIMPTLDLTCHAYT